MNLFGMLEVSGSALAAERWRAEVISANMANAETTRTPQGGAYRRQLVVFRARSAPRFPLLLAKLRQPAQEGVSVDQVVADSTPLPRRFEPGHPDADKEGYVSFPNIDYMTEFVNAMDASRAYQANLVAIDMAKQIDNLSLKILA